MLIPTLLLFASITFASHLPGPGNFVNDFANVLSPEFENNHNVELKNYKEKTTNEVTVVTVDTTGDDSVEDYSIHLAEQWKPGVEGVDNGVILLFAMNDRKMRIEVGRGVEDRLTDIEASRIIQNDITPEFKKANYEVGIANGINSVIRELDASPSAEVVVTSPNPEDVAKGLTIFIVLLIIGGIGLFIYHKSQESEEEYPSDNSEPDYNGALVGGALGYGLGRASSKYVKEEDEEDDTDYSSSDDDDDSSSFSSGSSWSSGGSDFGGGFSGGSFSGGGASGSW